MSHTKEYRGEKIEAGLTARLIPPGAQYSDSFCWLILLSVTYIYWRIIIMALIMSCTLFSLNGYRIWRRRLKD